MRASTPTKRNGCWAIVIWVAVIPVVILEVALFQNTFLRLLGLPVVFVTIVLFLNWRHRVKRSSRLEDQLKTKEARR